MTPSEHPRARYLCDVAGRPVWEWIVTVQFNEDGTDDEWDELYRVKSYAPDEAIRLACRFFDEEHGGHVPLVLSKISTLGPLGDRFCAAWNIGTLTLEYTDHPDGWEPGAEYRPEGGEE